MKRSISIAAGVLAISTLTALAIALTHGSTICILAHNRLPLHGSPASDAALPWFPLTRAPAPGDTRPPAAPATLTHHGSIPALKHSCGRETLYSADGKRWLLLEWSPATTWSPPVDRWTSLTPLDATFWPANANFPLPDLPGDEQ